MSSVLNIVADIFAQIYPNISPNYSLQNLDYLFLYSVRWLDILYSLDLPSYETTYSAIVTSLITLLLPSQAVEPLANFLLDLFSINRSTRIFIVQSYIPQIKQAFSNIQLSIFNKIALLFSTVGTIAKLVYAFLFQEQTFRIDFLTTPLVNQVK